MNSDELFKDMAAFENEGAEYMTPVQYSKVRPVHSPQIYAWIRNKQLGWKNCDCGRKVINVEEADELLRSKGKLPPKDDPADPYGYYEDRDETGRRERAEEDDNA
jgi:hypothetical protein